MLKRISPADLLTLDARRICLIKPSALGDIVQTLPLLPILRERFPLARISWVVASQFADLLVGHPYLDEVIPFHRKGGMWSFLRLLAQLNQQSFDLVFDLQGLLRTGVMTWATRAPVRVGLETAREGANLACHFSLPDTSRHVPAHLRTWRVAQALGLGHHRPETILPISDEDRAWAARRLSGLSPRRLVIHAGAQWETKRWPTGPFAFVAAKAFRAFTLSPVLVGTKGELDIVNNLEREIRKFVPAVRMANLAGETTLKQLAAVLEQADVVLSNDSGPMHMAAGLGRPVVAVFTCTSPVRSGPPGNQHALVSTQLPCAAGYYKRCPLTGPYHMACKQELEAERVWQALANLVEQLPERRFAA
jgi:lipopolysaccharide heptosyltransferase II